ncbi:hypothetical protein EDEG_02867 [Edhazardia aedis USNM 41457]|uniref:Uncharacterized protein n=1 Tax=Edhazardia aedis (strain USNM 41457) TaxID=1003232 RepID=J8ZST8_EDHAE|nr:hypothetical protein EDEG_02867 [Edhazardia aedis USNM 41457]|eukprot:EJW02728.1 hypothetical protein EDEG_02867 [Edhazardia aedis USNM 41457]
MKIFFRRCSSTDNQIVCYILPENKHIGYFQYNPDPFYYARTFKEEKIGLKIVISGKMANPNEFFLYPNNYSLFTILKSCLNIYNDARKICFYIRMNKDKLYVQKIHLNFLQYKNLIY